MIMVTTAFSSFELQPASPKRERCNPNLEWECGMGVRTFGAWKKEKLVQLHNGEVDRDGLFLGVELAILHVLVAKRKCTLQVQVRVEAGYSFKNELKLWVARRCIKKETELT